MKDTDTTSPLWPLAVLLQSLLGMLEAVHMVS